jgi:hypothetical protein
MRSQPLSRLLLLAAIGVAILGCAGAARVARAPDEPATVEITNVSGTLQVANSRSGQAIFQAAGLAPGRTVNGTVQLSNTGTLAAELTVAQLGMQDQPGAHGGRLSSRVQLEVHDVTGGSSIPVFSGPLGGLGSQPLGSIAPGAARTYRFTASLPNSGTPPNPNAGDNAYVGSGVTTRFVWTATANDAGDPPGTGGLGGSGTGGNGTAGYSPPRFSFRVSARRVLRRGSLDALVRCERSCSLEAWATLSKGRGARIAHRYARLPLPDRTARIRLNLSANGRKALRRLLEGRRRAVLRVHLRVLPAGGAIRRYSTQVVVKRPNPKRR